jgi:epoxyqueuosine reductase
MRLALVIRERALIAGFDLVGIAPAVPGRDLEFAQQWLERGYGGEMRYLHNPKRQDPRSVLPSAKSVICVGLLYNTARPYSTQVAQEGSRRKAVGSKPGSAQLFFNPAACSGGGDDTGAESSVHSTASPRGWISRYAWGQDYHAVVRAKLERLRAAVEALAPGVETRAYVDTGPIVERAFARFSGIGWMGKNTCLINEAKGSWFFLGVLLTGLELEPDLPAPDRCGSCTACLEACPTGALLEPYVMDASRCVSYFTIELKGSIPAEFRPAIGANIFGCDICQDVCPWNAKRESPESEVRSQNHSTQPSAVGDRPRKAGITSIAEFQPLLVEAAQRRHQEVTQATPATNPASLAQGSGLRTPDFSLFSPPLESLASLTEADFRRIFARSSIKRVKYRGWLRNLCVAMGNSGDRRFVPWLERAREHSDPVVREHAAWALERLHRT